MVEKRLTKAEQDQERIEIVRRKHGADAFRRWGKLGGRPKNGSSH